MWGDTAVRPVKSAERPGHEVVLSGGLHTYQGWEKFAALHPKTVHLLQFQVGVHDAWYFARELQNGVIALKIPRRLFTKGAAGITRSPDNYYKSGYLWKTLFPTSYTEEHILRASTILLQRSRSVFRCAATKSCRPFLRGSSR
ncbi:hypothetical protein D3C86_1146840 [compost metagenome]